MDTPESSLFIFYRLNEDYIGKEWKYPRLPSKWRWVGSGSSSSKEMPEEAQFSGPKSSQEKAMMILTEKFNELKGKRVVDRYRIYKKFPKLKRSF